MPFPCRPRPERLYSRPSTWASCWIFLFKRRLLQIRLCVVEIVLLIGSAVMEAAYYFLSWRVFSELSFHTQGFRPAIALPLVCLLFAYLAARAVFRDELMVRAADRIR